MIICTGGMSTIATRNTQISTRGTYSPPRKLYPIVVETTSWPYALNSKRPTA